MRKLTTKMAIKEDTFEPMLVLFLDDIKTNVSFSMEALQDTIARSGNKTAEEFAEDIIKQLTRKHSLTIEESNYYLHHFKDIIVPKNVNADSDG